MITGEIIRRISSEPTYFGASVTSECVVSGTNRVTTKPGSDVTFVHFAVEQWRDVREEERGYGGCDFQGG